MQKRPRQESFASLSGSPLEHSQGSTPAGDVSSPVAETDQRQKYVHLEVSEAKQNMIHCSLPPHPLLSFPTYSEYEVHYRQMHMNRCMDCHRNFPSDHFLSLHIAENHDPINATKLDRGDKIYSCFVEGCDKICSAPSKRRLHLVDKHNFPKNYDFFVVNDGLDNRSSMLRPDTSQRRRSSSAENATGFGPDGNTRFPESLEGRRTDARPHSKGREAESIDELVENISNNMASLKFVPPSVKFGRSKGGGGLSRR